MDSKNVSGRTNASSPLKNMEQYDPSDDENVASALQSCMCQHWTDRVRGSDVALAEGEARRSSGDSDDGRECDFVDAVAFQVEHGLKMGKGGSK